MTNSKQLDKIVDQSLRSLAQELTAGSWKGRREREIVSLFCFGYLLKHCRSGSPLHDRSQLALEVAVPQIRRQKGLTGKQGSKPQVCKDIVVWPEPSMVCWDTNGKATKYPLCIIEWKHNEKESKYDMQWLCSFSSKRRNFVGFAVCTSYLERNFTLSCTRVHLGTAVEKWLCIN